MCLGEDLVADLGQTCLSLQTERKVPGRVLGVWHCQQKKARWLEQWAVEITWSQVSGKIDKGRNVRGDKKWWLKSPEGKPRLWSLASDTCLPVHQLALGWAPSLGCWTSQLLSMLFSENITFISTALWVGGSVFMSGEYLYIFRGKKFKKKLKITEKHRVIGSG